MKIFPHLNKKYSGQPNDNLDLLEFITFSNAAEKIFQTNVVCLHKRNCPLIFIYWMEENDWKYAQHISSAGPEVSRKWQLRKQRNNIQKESSEGQDPSSNGVSYYISGSQNQHHLSTRWFKKLRHDHQVSASIIIRHGQEITWKIVYRNQKNHAQPLIYKKYYIICIGQLMQNICFHRTGESRIKSKCPITNTQRIKQIHILAMV